MVGTVVPTGAHLQLLHVELCRTGELSASSLQIFFLSLQIVFKYLAPELLTVLHVETRCIFGHGWAP